MLSNFRTGSYQSLPDGVERMCNVVTDFLRRNQIDLLKIAPFYEIIQDGYLYVVTMKEQIVVALKGSKKDSKIGYTFGRHDGTYHI